MLLDILQFIAPPLQWRVIQFPMSKVLRLKNPRVTWRGDPLTIFKELPAGRGRGGRIRGKLQHEVKSVGLGESCMCCVVALLDWTGSPGRYYAACGQGLSGDEFEKQGVTEGETHFLVWGRFLSLRCWCAVWPQAGKKAAFPMLFEKLAVQVPIQWATIWEKLKLVISRMILAPKGDARRKWGLFVLIRMGCLFCGNGAF